MPPGGAEIGDQLDTVLGNASISDRSQTRTPTAGDDDPRAVDGASKVGRGVVVFTERHGMRAP